MYKRIKNKDSDWRTHIGKEQHKKNKESVIRGTISTFLAS